MSTEGKEKKLRFLAPVEDLPFVRRHGVSLYDNILKEFMESNLKYAEVKETGGRKPITVALTLKRKLKKRGIRDIRVITRNKRIYIARMDE